MLYAYMTEEAARKLPGFEEYDYKGGGKGHRIPGMDLWFKDCTVHVMLSESIGQLPEVIKDVVYEITMYDTLYMSVSRETGIYRNGTAEARLDLPQRVNKMSANVRFPYDLFVKAKNLEDLRAIVEQIKTGTIRPEESYEGSQTGQSRKELEDAVRSLENSARRELAICDKKIAAIRWYAAALVEKFSTGVARFSKLWPFCRKSRVAATIRHILDHVE